MVQCYHCRNRRNHEFTADNLGAKKNIVCYYDDFSNGTFLVSLGDVIDPDRQIDLYCD